MDKRLGRYREGGGIETWPELNVAGQPAARPATTQEIGNRYFVVLPLTGNHERAVEELKAMVQAEQQASTPENQVAEQQPEAKRKRGDERGSSSGETAGSDREASTNTAG